jgi:creatinine amidohydrolase
MKIENCNPKKLKSVIEKFPVAFMAISPIEWHGEHLNFGSDPLRAEYVAKEANKKIGGVLFPTQFFGTDTQFKKQNKKLWYLENIVGKILPGNFLVSEKLFKEICESWIENVKRNGFRFFVIITGHLAPKQIRTFSELAKKHSGKNFKVIDWNCEKFSYPKELVTNDYLHAGKEETSEMLFINDTIVDKALYGSNEADISLELTKKLLKSSSKQFGDKRLNIEIDELVKFVQERIRN